MNKIQDAGHRINRALFLILLIITTLSFVAQTSPAETLEDRVSEISNQLMCPVCQGQSVAESNSDLAKDMRDVIRNKLKEGESEKEILDYFVSKYGETVLASPPAKGANWLLWLLPVFAVVFGGLGIGFFLYRSKRITSENDETIAGLSGETETKYFERIDEELDNFES